MKYHIDTIPLWEGFEQECECPLCHVQQKLEAEAIDRALGGSVMEPDTRVEVNRLGFCEKHLSQLYAKQNRLSLALMAHTNLKEIMQFHSKNKEAFAKQMAADEHRALSKKMSDALAHTVPHIQSCEALCADIETRSSTCIICEKLEGTMERYLETLTAIWHDDSEFRKTFSASRGFCLPHYAKVLRTGMKHLHGKKRAEFLSETMRIQEENLARLEKELEWFTLKYDYRNREKPWGTSKDAVERTLEKTRGWQKPETKN